MLAKEGKKKEYENYSTISMIGLFEEVSNLKIYLFLQTCCTKSNFKSIGFHMVCHLARSIHN